MPQWLQWALIIAGLAAIVVLLTFIRRQLAGLGEQRKRQQKAEAFQTQRRADMIESIRVIALAVEADQIEYSEACLRLKGLLDHVEPALLDQPPYDIFQLVHEKLEHMPTHRARKTADKKLVAKMDKERFSVEKEHAEAIRQAAGAIRQHTFK
ncbi:DUF2489 domain-containing protein [Marinobacter salinisoli]|uniref:DUF2489 domain-containing protein n=1 Tax=Marinobacter salinisoli TaxID=2769486 RepID=A0ABX7MX32_9GAMM|nr:DUF2489 domain-containing protein [Marinobacter salinisoli]QSP95939.1 DUF2489 domain-containing protein [Marinobacter salinisoli]